MQQLTLNSDRFHTFFDGSVEKYDRDRSIDILNTFRQIHDDLANNDSMDGVSLNLNFPLLIDGETSISNLIMALTYSYILNGSDLIVGNDSFTLNLRVFYDDLLDVVTEYYDVTENNQ